MFYNEIGDNMIEQLQELIDSNDNIVIFSGAGVSTLSGIKDFRSPDGLYSIKYKYPPEYMLSHDALINNTGDFFNFYRDYLNCLESEPNIVHNYLKKLEDKGKNISVITQNIDGLHTKAGSSKIYELHGTIYRNYCMNCRKKYDSTYIFNSKGIPKCNCGNVVRPDVVLYGEILNDKVISDSINAIRNSDLMIIIGTSLTVYPASSLIDYFNGKHLVIINRDTTTYDYRADLVINADLGKVFKKLN